jgi:hypothetical protein
MYYHFVFSTKMAMQVSYLQLCVCIWLPLYAQNAYLQNLSQRHLAAEKLSLVR